MIRTAPWTTPLEATGTTTNSRSPPSVLGSSRTPSVRPPCSAVAISGRLVKSSPTGAAESAALSPDVSTTTIRPPRVACIGPQERVDLRRSPLFEGVLGETGHDDGVMVDVAQ